MNKLHLVPRLEGKFLHTLWSDTDLENFIAEYHELLEKGKSEVKTKGFLETSERALEMMVEFHKNLKEMIEKDKMLTEEVSILNQKIKENKVSLKTVAKNKQTLETELSKVTKKLRDSQIVNADKKLNLESRDNRLVNAKEKTQEAKLNYADVLDKECCKKDEIIDDLNEKLNNFANDNKRMKEVIVTVEKGQVAMKSALNDCSTTLHTTLQKE